MWSVWNEESFIFIYAVWRNVDSDIHIYIRLRLCLFLHVVTLCFTYLGILPLYILMSAVNYDNCMTHIFQFSYFCYEQLEDWERHWCGDYCW